MATLLPPSGLQQNISTAPSSPIARPYERSILSLPVAIWLTWGYFVFRFLVGKASLAFLILAFLLVTVRAVRNRRVEPIVFWLPVLMGLVGAIIGSLVVGEAAVINYWIFAFFAFTIHSLGYTLFRPVAPRALIPFTLVFVLTVFPFIAYPDLSLLGQQPNDAAAELSKKLAQFINLETENRIRAYFFHSGELGAFAASLFVVLSQSFKYAGRKLGINWATVGELTLYMMLSSVVYATASTTAYIVMSYALLARLRRSGWLAPLPAVLLLAQLTTQLYFPREVATLLGQGSLMWRYDMAAIVKPGLQFFAFSPEKINDQSNWMHSIFLDTATLYGLIPVFVLPLVQLALPSIRQYRGLAYGWSCLFMVIAAIMPIGTSAVYIVVALALVYAESVSFHLKILGRPATTIN